MTALLETAPFAAHTVQWSCRVCGGDLAPIADLGRPCIGSIFPQPGEAVPRVPLRLMHCAGCGLVQLSDTTATELLYTDAYGYRSGINEQMVAHLRGIVERLAPLVGSGDAVLDIGCNDGTLLRAWAPYGPTRVGCDPIGEPVEDCEIVRDVFRADGRRYKAITSIAMFYDLQDPVRFACDIERSLAPGGVWALEVGYAGALRDGCWDGICHEHLAYYGLTQIADIGRRAGLRVISHEFTATNGGSLLVFLGAGGSRRTTYDQELTLAREARWRWDHMESAIAASAAAIRAAVERFGCVWALGASTKGNTVLQIADLGPDQVACAVERNVAKVGRETPGSRIPIVGEDALEQHQPEALLVLPYHFRDGLVARTRAAGVTSKMIFPLPRVEVVP